MQPFIGVIEKESVKTTLTSFVNILSVVVGGIYQTQASARARVQATIDDSPVQVSTVNSLIQIKPFGRLVVSTGATLRVEGA